MSQDMSVKGFAEKLFKHQGLLEVLESGIE